MAYDLNAVPEDYLPHGFAYPDGWLAGDNLTRASIEAEMNSRADGLPLPVELFGDVTPQLSGRYLIKGLLRASSAMVIFGLPGSAKSFLAVDIGTHIAAARDWFGRRVTGGGVVYIGAEGQGGLRARLEAQRLAHGFEGIPFALIPTSVDLLDPAAGDLAKLKKVLDHLSSTWGSIALVIIDTLAATFGSGDENGSDMAAYVANSDRLCSPYGSARIIVAHAPLNSDAKRPRGHGSLWGAADTVLHVTGDRDAPARRIHVLKQKDDDPGPDILFKLKQVEIGTDEDGDPVTSCVIEEAEFETCAPGKRRLSANEKIIADALGRTLESKGVFPPAEIPDSVLNRARTQKVVRLSEWMSEAVAALQKPDTHPDTPRRTVDRARTTLQASEIIGTWEEWAWLNF